MLVGSRIRSQTSYRASFAMQAVGAFMITFVDFLVILVLFTHLDAIAGWTLPQVAFLYGTSYIGIRLGDIFLGPVERVPEMIRSGSFDTFMVRPLGSLMQVITSEVFIHQIGALAQGVIILGYAIARAGIVWTPGRALLFVLMLPGAFAIFGAMFVASNAIAFWFVDSREVANTFTYGGSMLAQYPLNVFGEWLRRFLAFLVPIAFVNYFPSLYILGKRDPLGYPRVLQFASPVVAALACLVAAWIWRVAVRHYRSTGS